MHLNLHKSSPGNFVWSIRRGSNPVAHQSTVTIDFDSWHVGVNGLANVRKRGVRQVFAWAKGKELAPEAAPSHAQLISFNPFKEGKFVWASDRAPCDNLGKVYFTPSGAYAIR